MKFNISIVFTNQLVHHPQKLYRFYKQQRLDFLQLIPCLLGLDDTSDDFSLEPESFARFFKTFIYLKLDDFKRGGQAHSRAGPSGCRTFRLPSL